MNMRKICSLIVFVAVCILLGSCGSPKKIVYLQNADTIDYETSKGLFDAKIMPKDLLTITISTTDPRAAAPFNLSNESSSDANGTSYLVDNDGTISFPVVGRIQVGGMTKRQCEDYISEKIAPYMSVNEKPVVMVRMSGFKITVAGEVNSPGVYSVSQEKISVLEALAKAGDMTMYGKRDNVLLIREDATGEKSVHRLNIKDANLINSPYYYLQQNDYLYVEPNKTRINTSSWQSASIWLSSVGLLTSVASLVVNLTR